MIIAFFFFSFSLLRHQHLGCYSVPPTTPLAFSSTYFFFISSFNSLRILHIYFFATFFCLSSYFLTCFPTFSYSSITTFHSAFYNLLRYLINQCLIGSAALIFKDLVGKAELVIDFQKCYRHKIYFNKFLLR